MGWIVRLAETGTEGPGVEIMEVSRGGDLGDINNLGITLAEAKQLLAGVQREVSAAQTREHVIQRPVCPCCESGWWPSGFWRRCESRDGHRNADQEEPRCGWWKQGHTVLTAFTDGCPGLRGILAGAGVLEPPILDWLHIAMRLQHLKQVADGLAADDPARAAAKAVIVREVERLHWRIWNGKAKNAPKSIDRIRPVMHHFRGERDRRRSIARSRKLWIALRALDKYLTGQSACLVNYAERHRAGLRVGTAIAGGRPISG